MFATLLAYWFDPSFSQVDEWRCQQRDGPNPLTSCRGAGQSRFVADSLPLRHLVGKLLTDTVTLNPHLSSAQRGSLVWSSAIQVLLADSTARIPRQTTA